MCCPALPEAWVPDNAGTHAEPLYIYTSKCDNSYLLHCSCKGSRRPIYILNEDTQPVIRAIGVSHTACKDEFRQNIRSHSWSVYFFHNVWGDSVRSVFSSRPQPAIPGTEILGQIASFQRRLRGAAQTPLALPYPFRTWPGSGTWAERHKREVRNFLFFGRYTPELFLNLRICRAGTEKHI